jgi:tetratricopeptide (TPR) repeat protein
VKNKRNSKGKWKKNGNELLKMERTILISLLLYMGLFGGVLSAEEVSFSASAPQQVAVGERFRLVFSLNARSTEFSPPTFRNFRVLSGPSQSTSSSTQIINGQVSTSLSVTYTYILEALEEGEFQIQPARVLVDGKTYQSDPLHIRVSGKQTEPQTSAPSPSQQTQPDSQGTPGEKDLFIRAHVSKTNPFQSEQVIISYKLYTRLPVSAYSIEKLPSFQGFWSENLTPSAQPPGTTETIDGITYSVAEIRRVAVFPQRAGRLNIEPMEVECIVRMRSQQRSRSLFDDFFGGSAFDSFQNVRHIIRSNAITLDVKPLPTQNRPAEFKGMVGSYELTASLSHTEMHVNEAANLNLTISGSGNLRMAEQAFIQFPHNLEVFDPNVNDNIQTSSSGIRGERSFNYLMIPRTPGTYDVPQIKLVYFHPESGTYQTKTAGPFTIEVKGRPADGSSMPGSGQESVRMIGTDIRYIYTRPVALTTTGKLLFRSQWFYLLLVIPAIVFGIWMLWWMKQKRLRQDTVLLRNKKARKLADKRLKKARLLLKTNQTEAFYNEMSHALWGYLSDKLSLPMSEMSQEAVKQEFQVRLVSEDLINRFMELLEQCEYARFAPGSQETKMEEMYLTAVDIIIRMEKEIRGQNQLRIRNNKSILMTLFIGLLTCGTLQAESPADRLQEANMAYSDGAWAHAIELYEQLLSDGWEAPELYYNLGNAFFRENRLGPAILNYEKALRLAPGDENARFNLEVARTRIVDRIDPVPLIFYERWMKQLLQWQTTDNWAKTGLLCFVFFFLFAAFYLYASSPAYKKLHFVFALIMLVFSLGAFYAAQKQYYNHYVKAEAIVFAPRLTAKSAPGENSPDLFVIHEGTKVQMKQTIGEWVEIYLDNGNQGWVKIHALERI